MSCNCAQEMKALLYAAVEQAPSADVSESYVLDSFYGKFDEKFFHYYDKELMCARNCQKHAISAMTATREISTVREPIGIAEKRQQ